MALTFGCDSSVLCTLGLVQELSWDQSGCLSSFATRIWVAHAWSSLMIATTLSFLCLSILPLLLFVIWLRPVLIAFHCRHYLPSLYVLPALWTCLTQCLIDRHRWWRTMMMIIVYVGCAVDVQNYIIREHRLTNLFKKACSRLLRWLVGCRLSAEYKVERSICKAILILYLHSILMWRRQRRRSVLSKLCALLQLWGHITIWNIRLIIWIFNFHP